MSDALLILFAELLSVAGLTGLSGGRKARLRAALTPLAKSLEIGLARNPFGLTPIKSEKF